MAEAVIFDFDGVLVDSEPLHYEAENAVVERFSGTRLSDEVFSATVGMSDVDVYRHYAAEYGIAEAPHVLVQEGQRFFLELVDSRLKLVAGARELLAWLPQHAR